MRTKARSLDNLHQINSIVIQPIKVTFDPTKNVNHIIECHLSDEDSGDSDTESILHTRL